MTNSRRLVRVGMSFDLLFGIMELGYKIENGIECIEGLPSGAQFVESYTDLQTRVLYLVFSHPSFAEGEPGDMIPEMRIVHRVIAPHISTVGESNG